MRIVRSIYNSCVDVFFHTPLAPHYNGGGGMTRVRLEGLSLESSHVTHEGDLPGAFPEATLPCRTG